jgi:serine/threonine protein kinase
VAINETTNEQVAFKILNKQKIRRLGMQEKVKREVKAMKKLQHPHIVCL